MSHKLSYPQRTQYLSQLVVAEKRLEYVRQDLRQNHADETKLIEEIIKLKAALEADE